MLDKIKSISHIILVSVVAVLSVSVANKARSTLNKFDDAAINVKAAATKLTSIDVNSLNNGISKISSIANKIDEALTKEDIKNLKRTVVSFEHAADSVRRTADTIQKRASGSIWSLFCGVNPDNNMEQELQQISIVKEALTNNSTQQGGLANNPIIRSFCTLFSWLQWKK